MSLDKFKSIIEEKGRFVPENELEIFQQYDLRTSFGSFIHDTIRVIIYDASNNPLPQGKFGLVRYINKTDQPQYYKRIEGATKRSRRNYTIDVKKLIKDAGYSIGIFTVEMMFVNNRLGTQNKPNRVWIQEISPSRTEVRVLPFDVGDVKLNGLSLQEIIDERYNAFLDHEQFKEDIYEAIEPFLDLITTDDIRQLMINQVTEKIFNEIIKQYFKRDINEFNRIVNLLIQKFKEAVRYELLDKDSLIGPQYNVINPNFGKDKPTVRVSIDFPNFCFNKLLESLEVYIPKLVDVPETEFDEEIEQFPFPRVRPRINVPTQRDPNPTTTTTSTTSAPTNGTTTTTTQGPTKLPKIEFDRGQGMFKVGLYSNQPKNIVSRRTEDPKLLFIEYTGETTLQNITVRQYDIEKQSYVPKDLNFEFKKFDTTNETQWDLYNAYVKQENEQLTHTFNWTDAEREYAPISPIEPIIPIPGITVTDNPIDKDEYNTVVPDRGISYPWGVVSYDPTDNYPIPYYYFKNNNGNEKNIQIFKNNRLQISTNPNQLSITCSTEKLTSAILEFPGYFGKSHDVTNYSHSVETENWVFDGYYDWDSGQLLSKSYDFNIVITKDINIFIKWRRTSIPIRGYWVLRNPLNDHYLHKYAYRQFFTYAPFREIPAGSGLGAIPSPIQFGGTGDLKYINWSPQPELWTSRPAWQGLVKITDPTKGGIYQLEENTKQFLSDKQTFSRFEL